jgi:predicted amidohydrolase YtcJ
VTLLCCWSSGVVLAQAPDRIFYNGKVVTVDKDFSIKTAVAITGDRIVAVGDSATIRKLADRHTLQTNLNGRTLIPGLIDNHMHFLRTALLPGHDLRELETAFNIEQGLALIRTRAASVAKDEWLSALGGVHWNQFAEQRFPNLSELDQVAPNNPIYLSVSNSGPGSVNSRAKAFFESKGVPVGSDGKIEAGENTIRAWRAVSEMFGAHDLIKRATQRQMAFASSVGLTMIGDNGGTIPEGGYLDPATGYDPFLELMREGKVPVRIRLFLPIMETEDSLPILRGRLDNAFRNFGNDMVKVVGFGEWLADRKYQTMNPLPEFYEKAAKLAAKRGWTYEQHVISLSQIKAHLDVWERVNKETPIAPLRWSLMHLNQMDQESIERAKALGIGLMAHSTPYYDAQPKQDGPLPPFRWILDSGVKTGGGSDGARIATMNPWPMIYYMITGKNGGGKLHNPGQLLTREESLRMWTASNGWFTFDEDKVGSIEPGKLADLVVLSKDYLDPKQVPDEEVRNIKSLLTMVGGKIVHSTPGFK